MIYLIHTDITPLGSTSRVVSSLFIPKNTILLVLGNPATMNLPFGVVLI
jgi:hypothetical protein